MTTHAYPSAPRSSSPAPATAPGRRRRSASSASGAGDLAALAAGGEAAAVARLAATGLDAGTAAEVVHAAVRAWSDAGLLGDAPPRRPPAAPRPPRCRR